MQNLIFGDILNYTFCSMDRTTPQIQKNREELLEEKIQRLEAKNKQVTDENRELRRSSKTLIFRNGFFKDQVSDLKTCLKDFSREMREQKGWSNESEDIELDRWKATVEVFIKDAKKIIKKNSNDSLNELEKILLEKRDEITPIIEGIANGRTLPPTNHLAQEAPDFGPKIPSPSRKGTQREYSEVKFAKVGEHHSSVLPRAHSDSSNPLPDRDLSSGPSIFNVDHSKNKLKDNSVHSMTLSKQGFNSSSSNFQKLANVPHIRSAETLNKNAELESIKSKDVKAPDFIIITSEKSNSHNTEGTVYEVIILDESNERQESPSSRKSAQEREE